MDLRARNEPVRRRPGTQKVRGWMKRRMRVERCSVAKEPLPSADCACDKVCTIAPPREWPPTNMLLLLLLFMACRSAFSASATAMSMAGGTGTPPKHCGRAIHSWKVGAGGKSESRQIINSYINFCKIVKQTATGHQPPNKNHRTGCALQRPSERLVPANNVTILGY
jgi:hypothetical protein